MTVHPRQTRLVLRYLHLGIGVLLGAYVYWPPGEAEPVRLFLMLVGVPLVVVSGVALWQQAGIRRALRRLRSAVPPPRRASVRFLEHGRS